MEYKKKWGYVSLPMATDQGVGDARQTLSRRTVQRDVVDPVEVRCGITIGRYSAA